MTIELFDSTKREIGVGKQAKVYYWNGFAYKIYDFAYPTNWIDYEIQIQNEINKTSLSTVKYYKTDNPRITKMDYIDGITLGDRMIKEKYKQGIEDLILLQNQVHLVENINIPNIKITYENEIKCLDLEIEKKKIALHFLSDIEEKHNLCHLDFHMLNVMYSYEKYYIIDWINAKLGNPIFDYARTYVILYEVAYRLSQKYLTLLKKDKKIDIKDINKAIYIMAILRTKESNSEKLNQLIQHMINQYV